MIKVIERFPNFVDPGDDYKHWTGEFETLSEVFNCELAEKWKIKLGDEFIRIAINEYPDSSGLWIGDYMLSVYDKENVYNIANIR